MFIDFFTQVRNPEYCAIYLDIMWRKMKEHWNWDKFNGRANHTEFFRHDILDELIVCITLSSSGVAKFYGRVNFYQPKFSTLDISNDTPTWVGPHHFFFLAEVMCIAILRGVIQPKTLQITRKFPVIPIKTSVEITILKARLYEASTPSVWTKKTLLETNTASSIHIISISFLRTPRCAWHLLFATTCPR